MSSDATQRPKEDKFYEFKPFRVPKYRIAFQRAGQLADIPGYVWYTPAPLYLWGRYSDVNLSDVVQQHDIQIFWYRFDKPVFQGFTANGDPSWNHVLWAAKEDQWVKLVNAVLETVQFDIPKSRLYQYALQQLSLYDPLSLDTQKVLTAATPVVPVQVFAVLTNERQYAFDTRNPEVRVQPSVVSFPPSDLHVNAAKQLFARAHLTQDTAFATYKEILLSTQDQSYRSQIQQNGLKR